MKRTVAILFSVACLCIGAAPGLSIQADQKIVLSNQKSTGDVFEMASEVSMDLNATASAPGQTDAPMHFSMRDQERYQETILSANSVRRIYHTKTSDESNPAGKKQAVSSLQGKTVTIRQRTKQKSITVDHGVISQEDRDSLQDELDDLEGMFPDHPLAVGEEWSPAVIGAIKSKELPNAKVVSAQARIVEIIEHLGHRCAHFQVSVVLAAKLGGSLNMKFAMDGDGYEALDLHRMLSLDVSGPILIEEETKEASATGSGFMQLHFKNTWVKVAGKPVQNKLP